MRAYHKPHVSKSVGIYVVGVDFQDILENGGRAIKLVFQISKSAKVRHRKLVAENGVIIKNKWDIHYVDCNITGSNDVTPKDTKFQLRLLCEKFLLTVIEKLVCYGGPFERFDLVI